MSEMRAKWGWFLALGLLLVVLGTIALYNTFIATVASVFTIGFLLLIGGVAQIAHAFGVKSWSGFFWWLLAGIIYALGGLYAIFDPIPAALILTLLLASVLIVGGVLRIIVALRERPRRFWGWVLAAGSVSLLAGLVIAIGWPISGLWVLGLFLAIDLIFQGWALVAVALGLRRGDSADATTRA
ncbi:MAG TPA: HdeD family acid-resistance protein [Mesorhizobium sp.]|nr:HdeD family acid-resistance protein [Mesorhizobium sp.]